MAQAKKAKKVNKKDNKERKSVFNADNMKVIVPLVISTIFLIILVAAASYAYFQIVTSISSTPSKLKAQTGDIGSVAIKSSQNDLILDLAPIDMIQKFEDVPYYGSVNGATTEETSEVMGTISVKGEGVFDCEYAMEIVATSKSADSHMYTKFQNMVGKSEGQIVLTITTQNGDKVYDFNTEGLFTESNSYKQVFENTVTGLQEGTSENILAQLKIVNKTGVVQDDLKNTDITLSLSISKFNCEIVG